jgi:CubicO group peptidase (beta-lactamase class C family)
VVAVAVARALAAAGLDFDVPLTAVLPHLDTPKLTGLRLRDLLQHTANLCEEALTVSPTSSRQKILAAVRDDVSLRPWTAGAAAAYSRWLNWWLLGEVLGHLEQRSPLAASQSFLRAAGMDNSSVFLPAGTPRGDDIASIELRDAVSQALAVEPAADPYGDSFPPTDPSTAFGFWPGLSGLGPAKDLGRLFESILAARIGASALVPSEFAKAMTRPSRVGLFDEVRRNNLTWGLGFVVDRRCFGAGWTDDAFGHTSDGSAVVAVADPQTAVVAVICTDGVPPRGNGAFVRHVSILRALARDIAEATPVQAAMH